jgi:hypothetical protein
MKTAVAALHPPAGEGRKPSAAGTKTEWRTITRVQEPDAAHRHIALDFMTAIWCGATVGCIGAAVTPPFSEDLSCREPS